MSLLVATVIFAAGAVYVNYQLDAFRASVTAYLEDRVGADLSMGPVSVDGLRGLRIDGLEVSLVARNGVSAKLSAPVAFAQISLNDLGRLI